jgi:hypothetical protein
VPSASSVTSRVPFDLFQPHLAHALGSFRICQVVALAVQTINACADLKQAQAVLRMVVAVRDHVDALVEY